MVSESQAKYRIFSKSLENLQIFTKSLGKIRNKVILKSKFRSENIMTRFVNDDKLKTAVTAKQLFYIDLCQSENFFQYKNNNNNYDTSQPENFL